ncbi:hypothetical protein P280DRAFT_468657 [Massarina eburnea CBS 473.64]|uniref:Heterokaryon incompatibility domain-containing protein n=1 Tax=Massarina eburnea CBS 473.64 TaxID=1395130 RepID=A0A6A6S7R8_9PLEO|nr:hypothetical protein P280DRAFT_468657 [Massarina eburnea CBS 473.64]
MSSDSLHRPLEVPILSAGPVAFDNIYSFPKEQGWTQRTIGEWQDLFLRPTKEFQAFLQTWLFFGPLASLTDDPSVFTKFFDQRNSPRTRQPLEAFCSLAEKLVSDLQSQSDGWVAWLQWKRNHLDPAVAMHNRFAFVDTEEQMVDLSLLQSERDLATFIMNPRDRDPRDPSDIVATAILLEHLQNTSIVAVFSPMNVDIPEALSHVPTKMYNANIMWNILREDGWCPFEIEAMSRCLSTGALHFMSTTRRPDDTKPHNMIRIRSQQKESNSSRLGQLSLSEGEKLCTPYNCSIRQIPNDNYETVHCSDCLGCFDVEADANELEAILLRDDQSIPLIMSIDPEDQSKTIHMVASQPDVAYVSISHVWSDGLGNPKRNAIPHCQLLRLSKMVRSLGGENKNTVLFWFDTICVPPDGTGKDKVQELAMERMRQTYESANAVIVLDKWLLSSKAIGTSDAELILRISFSVWNRRLWTYQEAALARTLYFHFQDSIFNMDEAFFRLCESEDRVMTDTLMGDIYKRYMSLRTFKWHGKSLATKLKVIIDACMLRATSVHTDEALCLGALLNLDMAQILEAPPQARMQKLFSLLPPSEVPINILQFSDTLPTQAFRWAPRTLLASNWNLKSDMNFGTHYWDEEPICGTVADAGFRVKVQGLVFKSHYPLGAEFYVADNYDNWFNIKTYLIPGENTSPSKQDINGVIHDKLKWKNPKSTVSSVVFIPFSLKGFATQIFHEHPEDEDEADLDAMSCFGMLGLVEGETDSGDSFVRKICPASFLKMTSGNAGENLASLYIAGMMFGIDTGRSAHGSIVGWGGDRDVFLMSRGSWTEANWCID